MTPGHCIDGSVVDTAINQVELGSPLRVRATVKNLGNVRVVPQMVLEVQDPEGTTVFNEAFLQQFVFPNETGGLVAEWDTTGQELGEYTVVSSINFGEFLPFSANTGNRSR